MRISKLFLGLLAAFSVMFFVACSDDDKSGGNNIPNNHPIIGVWEYSESSSWKEVLEFRQNGTAERRDYWDGELEWSSDRTYTVKGNIITLYDKDIVDYRISGNTLTIFDIYDGEEWSEDYTRVGSGSGIVGTWKTSGSDEYGSWETTIVLKQNGTGTITGIYEHCCGRDEWSDEFTYTASNGKLTVIMEGDSFTYTGGDSFTIYCSCDDEGCGSRTFVRAGTARSRAVAVANSEAKRCENRAKTNILRSRR